MAVANFDEVIDRLRNGRVVDFEYEPRQNPPCIGCSRAFFTFKVAENDYDAFFNSPVGYRAQYCAGSSHGESENRRLIGALTTKLLSFAESQGAGRARMDQLSASLAGADAKIWITEEDFPDSDEVQVNYAPWVEKARASAGGTIAEQAARANAHAGVLAPIGTCLEIKGAWIDDHGNECRDPAKANRGTEIQVYGFS